MQSHRETRPTAAAKGWRVLAGPIAALLLGLGATLPAHTGAAQEMWVERTKVVDQLAKSHREAPAALGLTEEGAVIELFRTADGATWTLVLTLPNGYSRVIGSGEAWIALPLPVKGKVS